MLTKVIIKDSVMSPRILWLWPILFRRRLASVNTHRATESRAVQSGGALNTGVSQQSIRIGRYSVSACGGGGRARRAAALITPM